jgi:hypothetical protein
VGDKRSVEINISGIHAAGVGGLGLFAVTLIATIVLGASWFFVIGLIGGAALGVALVLRSRRAPLSRPDGSAPISLFGSENDASRDPSAVAPRDELKELAPTRKYLPT